MVFIASVHGMGVVQIQKAWWFFFPHPFFGNGPFLFWLVQLVHFPSNLMASRRQSIRVAGGGKGVWEYRSREKEMRDREREKNRR